MKLLWQEDGIVFFDELASTQNAVKDLMARGGPVRVVAAGRQTAGRGQNANAWHSPEGGLYFTWVDTADFKPEALGDYTRQICLKIKKEIEVWCGKKLEIKLPNDIFLNGKKVAGILCERFVRGNQVSPVLVGVGVNLNIEKFPMELKNIATSLKLETGTTFDLKQKLRELVRVLARPSEDSSPPKA